MADGAVPARYEVVEVAPYGTMSVDPSDIDATGDVVGTFMADGNRIIHAFRRTPAGVVDLGTDGTTQSNASGTNDLGDTAGELVTREGSFLLPEATVFRRDGSVQRLGTLGGRSSSAIAINDRGDVVGWSQFDRYLIYKNPHACLWRDGVIRDLGTLGPVPLVNQSSAEDVNELGDVVGWSYIGREGPTHAFRWRDGVMTDLGTLGGTNSAAFAINDIGQIVGSATAVAGGRSYAVMWENGVIRDLGTLNGTSAAALDVNNHGDVVGYTHDGAVLFSGGRVIDLETMITPVPGLFFTRAVAINDRGDIAVWSNGGHTSHGVILRPVWCGNGTIEEGETCDGGPCCTAACEPAPAGTLCRTAIDACDVTDTCEDGSGSCPDARVPDSDDDGLCDAVDDCSAAVPLLAFLRTTGWRTDRNDVVVLRVVADVAAPVDPAAGGVIIRLEDDDGAPILELHAPPGAWDTDRRSGWRRSNGARAVYTGAAADAIDRLTVSWDAVDPNRLHLDLRARQAGLLLGMPPLPLQARIVIGADAGGGSACTDTRFGDSSGPSCTMGRNGDAVVCR
ncbi:MAG TPA: hypothetical protein VGR62_09615 [Candidatus Binatia bacterium]|nr:hypothetical protein [Candidatus Binatia bacterium]